MNKWKKFLATCLTAGMVLGLMPTTAWAAAAQVIVEPTYVYGQVYNFDANNKALVNDTEWKPMVVTASDAGLTAAPAGSLSAYQDEATGKYGYRDENDKIVISAAYDDIFTWSADDSVKLLIVDKDGKDGAIDRKGKTVIPFQYSYLCPSYGTDGKYYEAMTEEGWGVLDASGKTVIPTVYDYITNYDELPGGVPVFWASQGESDVLVSAVNGQPVFTVPAEVYVRGDFNGGNLVAVWNSTIQKGGYGRYRQSGRALHLRRSPFLRGRSDLRGDERGGQL